MSKFKLAVIRAAQVLAKKKIYPVRVSQSVNMPLGPLHVVFVGDLRKGFMPTRKDLVTVRQEISRQTHRVPGLLKTKFAYIIFPPILKIQEVYLPGGTFFVFKLGDLGLGIMPTLHDLEQLRKMVKPEFERLGMKTEACFFPPILNLTLVDDTVIACLGDADKNIIPSRRDGSDTKKILQKALKSLGVKKVMVMPDTGNWRSDAKAFV